MYFGKSVCLSDKGSTTAGASCHACALHGSDIDVVGFCLHLPRLMTMPRGLAGKKWQGRKLIVVKPITTGKGIWNDILTV